MDTDYFDAAVLAEMMAQFGYENVHAATAEVVFFSPDSWQRNSSFQGAVFVEAQQGQQFRPSELGRAGGNWRPVPEMKFRR